MFRLVLAAVAANLLCGIAFGDTIVLKNGGRLRGKIVSENEKEVVINVANAGTVTVKRSRIEEIRKDRRGPLGPAREERPKETPPSPKKENSKQPREDVFNKTVTVKIKDEILTSALVKLAQNTGVTITVSDEAKKYIEFKNLKVSFEYANMTLQYALNFLVRVPSNSKLDYKRTGDYRVAVLTRDELKPAAPGGPASEILEEYKRKIKGKDGVELDFFKSCRKKLTDLGDKATADLSHKLKSSKDWRVRYLAVSALENIKDPDSIPALIHAIGDGFVGGLSYGSGPANLEDSKAIIRNAAIRALNGIGQKAYEALLEAAADKYNEDQKLAIEGLKELKVSGRAGLFTRLVKDKSQKDKIRGLAAKGLIGLGHEAHLTIVEELTDPVIRRAVVGILWYTRDKELVGPLYAYVRKLESDYPLARAAACGIRGVAPDWRPQDTNEYVDYILLLKDGHGIKEKVGSDALSRLRYWTSKPQQREMCKEAKRALRYLEK